MKPAVVRVNRLPVPISQSIPDMHIAATRYGFKRTDAGSIFVQCLLYILWPISVVPTLKVDAEETVPIHI